MSLTYVPESFTVQREQNTEQNHSRRPKIGNKATVPKTSFADEFEERDGKAHDHEPEMFALDKQHRRGHLVMMSRRHGRVCWSGVVPSHHRMAVKVVVRIGRVVIG